MDVEISKERPSKSTGHSSFFLVAQIVLRILATIFATASVVTLLTSNRDINQPLILDGQIIDVVFLGRARYSYASALSYKLIVDAGVLAFSLLSFIVALKVVKFAKANPEPSFYFYLLILDGVMTTMSISGCAAGTTIGLVAKKGIIKPGISWAPICHSAQGVDKFCTRITLSVGFSYAAFACLAALTLIVAWKLKSLATK